MLNEEELQRIKDTMEMLGEVGPFTSSSDPTTSAGQQSVEIDAAGEALSARVSLGEVNGGKRGDGNEEKEGGIRSLLRRLAEENFV